MTQQLSFDQPIRFFNPAFMARIRKHIKLRNILLLFSFILFLIAWNRGIALLYGMFTLVVSILIVGYIFPYLSLKGVSVSRKHPLQVTEGEPLMITCHLRNARQTKRCMLELIDSIPCANGDMKAPLCFIPRLKTEKVIKFEVVCDWRGVHTLGPLRLRSSYPLGIHRVESMLPGTMSQVVVYPSVFPIDRMGFEDSSHADVSGVEAATFHGNSGEVMGLREYRSGDCMRHIHWPVSARQNELIIKEYETINNTDICIVLDLNRTDNVGQGKHSTLEYSVKIAASIAQYGLTRGHRVSLVGHGVEPVYLPPGTGLHYLTNILEILAYVQADGNIPYEQTMRDAAARTGASGILVVFENLHPGRKKMDHRLLNMPGTRRIIVEFDSQSFITGEKAATPGGRYERNGITVYRVGRDDDLVEVFNQ